jgi:hypothetical protein
MNSEMPSTFHRTDSIGAPLIVAALAIIAVSIVALRWLYRFLMTPKAMPAAAAISQEFAERFGITAASPGIDRKLPFPG